MDDHHTKIPASLAVTGLLGLAMLMAPRPAVSQLNPVVIANASSGIVNGMLNNDGDICGLFRQENFGSPPRDFKFVWELGRYSAGNPPRTILSSTTTLGDHVSNTPPPIANAITKGCVPLWSGPIVVTVFDTLTNESRFWQFEDGAFTTEYLAPALPAACTGPAAETLNQYGGFAMSCLTAAEPVLGEEFCAQGGVTYTPKPDPPGGVDFLPCPTPAGFTIGFNLPVSDTTQYYQCLGAGCNPLTWGFNARSINDTGLIVGDFDAVPATWQAGATFPSIGPYTGGAAFHVSPTGNFSGFGTGPGVQSALTWPGPIDMNAAVYPEATEPILLSAIRVNDSGEALALQREVPTPPGGGAFRQLVYLTGTPPPVPPPPPPFARWTEQSGANFPESTEFGDPVNLLSGEFVLEEAPDLDLGGPLPLKFQRFYGSRLNLVGDRCLPLGQNWRHNFEIELADDPFGRHFIDERGRIFSYVQNTITLEWIQQNQPQHPRQLVEYGGDFIQYDPLEKVFYAFGSDLALERIFDENGNTLSLSYQGDSLLQQVSDGLGRTITFSYSADTLKSVSDGARTVSFDHDPFCNLEGTTDPFGFATGYGYSDPNFGIGPSSGLMTDKTKPEGNATVTVIYNDNDFTPVGQTDGEGNLTEFDFSGCSPYDPYCGCGPGDPSCKANGKSNTSGASTPPWRNGATFVTPPIGSMWDESFDTEGLPIDLNNHDGNHSFSNDAAGRRDYQIDPSGRETRVTYHGPTGQIATYQYPDGTTISNTFASRAKFGLTIYDRTSTTYPDGTSHGFSRDANGNILTFTDRAGRVTTFTYHSTGQVESMTAHNGSAFLWAYNADGTLASSTDPLGNTTQYGYDALLRRNTVTWPGGAQRLFTHDSMDRILTITAEDGGVITNTFDKNGNLKTISDQLGNVTTYAYDGNESVTTIMTPAGGALTYAYDERGDFSEMTDPVGNKSFYEHDEYGTLTKYTDPGGGQWRRSILHGVLNSVTNPLSKTTSFGYDQNRLADWIEAPDGSRREFTKDDFGRVTGITEFDGKMSTFTHDARGRLASTDVGGMTAGFARDDFGQIDEVTDPAGGKWPRTYDANGRMKTQADPLGRTTTFSYDGRGRRTQIQTPEGTETVQYDPVGRATQRTIPGKVINYGYDAKGRLTSATGVSMDYNKDDEVKSSNGQSTPRDLAGKITSATLAPGKTVVYGYDSRSLVMTVTDWAGGVTTFTYDAAGRRTGIARPNGINTTFSFDDFDRVVGIEEGAAGAVSTIALTRDPVGRVLTAARSFVTKDLLDQVTDEAIADNYDAADQTADNSYDGNGRRTADDRHSYTWDLDDRLTGYSDTSTSVTFEYDGLGNLVSRTEGGETRSYVWNYSYPLPSITVEKVDGVDSLYFVLSPSGYLLYSIGAMSNNRLFHHFDEQGTTVILTDDTSAVVRKNLYSPYGELLGAVGTAETPFTFNAKFGVLDDGSSGLYHMRRRVFDALARQFLSPDPIKDHLQPQDLNPYKFAANNPLLYVDPLGTKPEEGGTDGKTVKENPYIKASLALGGEGFKEGLKKSPEWVLAWAHRTSKYSRTLSDPQEQQRLLRKVISLGQTSDRLDKVIKGYEAFGDLKKIYEGAALAYTFWQEAEGAAEEIRNVRDACISNMVNQAEPLRRLAASRNWPASYKRARMKDINRNYNECSKQLTAEVTIPGVGTWQYQDLGQLLAAARFAKDALKILADKGGGLIGGPMGELVDDVSKTDGK